MKNNASIPMEQWHEYFYDLRTNYSVAFETMCLYLYNNHDIGNIQSTAIMSSLDDSLTIKSMAHGALNWKGGDIFPSSLSICRS